MVFDGTDQRSFAIGGVQNGFDQKSGCALAIGSRDSNNSQAFSRSFVKVCAQARQGTASMRNQRPRNSLTRIRFRRVGNNRRCTGGDCTVDELVAVAGITLHGDKQITRLDSSGIVFQTADGGITTTGKNLRTLQKLLERHWSEL